MTESQSFLLTLVRMALWRGEESLPADLPDWQEVLALAKKQTLLGLVAEAVPMLPEGLQPDPQTKLQLHAAAMRIMSSHALLNRKVADIKTRMDSYGIHTVLFKGQGVALNYPNPQSRQCGDIDLYVGEKNFARALELLNPETTKKASEYRFVKHFNIEEDGVEIEIHRIAEILPGFGHDRRFQRWTVDKLCGPAVRKVEIGGATVNLPPAEFDVLYIMNHAWHHFMTGGIGLRQLCDWSIQLHRYGRSVDVDALSNNLRSFGLIRAWKILSCVAVGYLGLPEDECPLYDASYAGKAAKVLDVIWMEGNFGHHSESRKTPRPKGHFAGKFHSFKKNTSRIIRILSISPIDVIYSWGYYFINGMRNLFHRVR